MDDRSTTPGGSVGARWLEAAVALALQGIAVAVIVDSVRVGVGWADDGPRSGYFPFIVGVLLLAAASAVLVGRLRAWRTDRAVFAQTAQLRQVAAIGIPIVLYVAAIALVGLYVASFVLIAAFMVRHGEHRAWTTAAVSIGVPALAFVVFERWFLVPLPKGPLEAMVGL